MGKFQSKHECFFVNPALNEALKDDLWKSDPDLNLDSYNMDDALSELSLRLEEKTESSPLRVELPPAKTDTDATKLFNLDELSLEAKEKNKGKSNISIEDFRYGVQLETSENSKQEWFFTLYNFDGHGRITKEDLASLLKALYDAVGSSIKLPPNGAKTLKLRLSVGQDQAGHLKNVTNLKSADMSRNTVSDSKMLKSKVKDFSKLNNLMQAQVKCSNEDQSHGPTNQDTVPDLPLPTPAVDPGLVSPQAQQADKGRIQLKQLRRQQKDNRKESNQHHKRRYRHSGAYCPVLAAASALAAAEAAGKAKAEASVKAKTEQGFLGAGKVKADVLQDISETPAAQESQDRRNYYLDLAGVENNFSKFQNNLSNTPPHHHPHHRSRSHDIAKCDNLRNAESRGENWLPIQGGCPNKCDNVQRENERLKNKHSKSRTNQQHSRSKSFDAHENSRNSGKAQHRQHSAQSGHLHRHSTFQTFGLGGATGVPLVGSPHHHRRHRHREKDHELAMQQVAQWIKREHSWGLSGEGDIVVQRHEHHHIHEHHHHHHYHHYYET